jgi:hypothetical protein
MQDLKMQDWKMTDKIAGVEIAGPENEGQKFTAMENAGQNLQTEMKQLLSSIANRVINIDQQHNGQ